MAITKSGAQTLHHAPGLYNLNHVDALLADDGSIVFAMAGGDNNLNALLRVGTLAPGGTALGSIADRVIPQATDGLPFSSVNRVQLEKGPAGQIAALLHLPEHGLGAGDLNNALLVQRVEGGVLSGPLSPVSPADPTDRPSLYSSLVWLGNGGYAVLTVDETNVSAQPNPITWQRFDAAGVAQGPAVEVVPDTPAGGLVAIDRNPTMVSAATLAAGRVAMVWNETSPFAAPTFGQPQVKMQILRPDGSVAVAPVVIDGTSAQRAQVLALDGGGFVVAWQDYDVGNQGIWKAQVVGGNGVLLGSAFEISSTLSPQEGDLSLVALRTGGFAATWRDMQDHTFLARMFDARGKATGHDFQILDTAQDFLGAKAGMVAQDGAVTFWMAGLNPSVGSGFVLQAQTFGTETTLTDWRLGDTSDDLLAGGALDDRLNGRDGNDVLQGGAGNDILLGGHGRDRIFGGAGRDQIEGGANRDILTGGAGGDSFVFRTAGPAGDRITDFNGAEGDRLVFYKAGFGGAAGVLSGASLNSAHQGLFFETSTGLLTYDPDGNGAAARVLVVELTGVSAVAWDDLVFL